jgi:hypothetical protein
MERIVQVDDIQELIKFKSVERKMLPFETATSFF